MVWPIPTAKSIFSRLAAAAETGIIAIRPAADVVAVSRAVRSAKGVFAQFWGAVAPEIRSIHDHVAWWARQYMPDSADDETMILRHAAIWGIEQRPAKKAVGKVTIEGVTGTVLAAGVRLASSDSVAYVTTTAGTIVGGVVTVAAEAAEAGQSANLEAGIRLSLVEAMPDLTKVTVAVAFAGGLDAETPQEIQLRTLERIREPPMGGAASDYKTWVASVADVYAVRVVEDWVGRGSVGVIVALKAEDGSALVPTPAELAAIGAHLGVQGSQTGVRPVTARVVPVAAELAAVPVTLRLRPDTVLNRTAIAVAYARFIATIGDEEDDQNDGAIGAVIEPSRLSEALSAADGEYAHDLIVPAGRYTLATRACPVAGVITYAE